MSLLVRLIELLPLSLVLGTSMAALRNEGLPAIQRAALRNTARIVAYLVLGCVGLQAVLWVVQD